MKKPKRKNGLLLTVKQLDKRAYNAIHLLKRGYRQDSMKGLLDAAADLAEKNPNWYQAAVTKKLVLSVKK